MHLSLLAYNILDILFLIAYTCTITVYNITKVVKAANQGRSQDFYCGGLKPPRYQNQEPNVKLRCHMCLGGRVWEAVVPLPSVVGSGEGAVPHPQKIF